MGTMGPSWGEALEETSLRPEVLVRGLNLGHKDVRMVVPGHGEHLAGEELEALPVGEAGEPGVSFRSEERRLSLTESG